MLSNKEIICPINLLDVAHKKKDIPAGIVNAGKMLPMLSVIDAVKENLINPILIGDKDEIQKCAEELQFDISKYEIIHEPKENSTAKIAAKLASQGKIKIIVKGHIHTDVLMKEVIKKEYNLLGKTRLSHIWHMTLEKNDQPIIITDGALNVSPNVLVKMMIYFMGACAAGVVVGGKVPVVITSRSDEATARMASIAAAVVALD